MTAALHAAPAPIHLTGRPVGGAAVAGRLWVLVDRGGVRRAVEVDPGAGRPTGRSVRVGAAGPPDGPRQWQVQAPPQIVVARGALWTLDAPTRTALRIDTVRARVAARVPVRLDAIAAGDGGLWGLGPVRPLVVDHRRVGTIHRLVRIDPRTGAVRGGRSFGPGAGTTRYDRLAVGADRGWVSAPSASGRSGGEVEWGGVGARAMDVWRFTAHAGALFTAVFPCTMIVRPGTAGAFQRSLRMLPTALCAEGETGSTQPQDVVAGPADSVWELVMRGMQPGARRLPGVVAWRRIDGRGPLHTAVVGRDPGALIADGDRVWVIDRAGGRLFTVRGRDG